MDHQDQSSIIDMPDHALFRDFREQPLRPDVMLIFPMGAGGNFLAHLMTMGTAAPWPTSNEFRGEPWFWCGLDNELASRARWDNPKHLIYHLDDLHGSARLWIADLDHDRHPKIAMSHRLPIFSHAAFDLHSREMVFIDTSADCEWFVHGLWVSKHMLDPSLDQRPHLVNLLLQLATKYELNRSLSPDLWYIVWDMLSALPVDVRNTVAAWDFVICCAMREITVSEDAFRRHMDGLLDPSNYFRRGDPLYHQRAKQWLAPHADVQVSRTYAEIFFDNRPWDTRIMDSIDRESIKLYTLKNIQQLEQLASLMTKRCGDDLLARLLDLRARIGG